MLKIFRLLLCILALSLMTGCYNKPVRHLASDISLIQKGSSTRQDVLLYLGEPDDTEVGSKGLERWVYTENITNTKESIPYIGKYLGSPEVTKVEIVLQNGVVVDTRYNSFDEDDTHWQDDFDWQEDAKETEEDDGWF